MSGSCMQTTLCYIELGDMYLMLHRNAKPGDINEDKWIGVGGKFEPGESPEECMLREVREETGLTATQWRYRGLVTFVLGSCVTEYMHLFTISGWKGELRACDEGSLEWVQKDLLTQLPHWKGDEIFLSLIANPDNPFFSLKLVYDEADQLQFASLDGSQIDLERWEWA